jgi:hypothetical protein
MAFDATWRYTSGSLSAIDTTPTPTPTTTTPARTPGPISGDTSLALLEAMNKARKDYGVSPISWTSGLSKKAWTQAQHCSWDYSFPNVQDQYPDAQVAVAMTTPLVDGITNGFLSPAYAYNYSTPGVDGDNVYARGLTQIVWRQTKAVGCAWNKCTGLTGFGANEDAQLITCWFDAQGTYLPGNTVSFELNMPLKLTA